MKKRVPFYCIFLSLCALFEICSFSSFPLTQKTADQPGQALPVQRRADPAEESTLSTPDRLSSIGSQSRMKNWVSKFYISTICCISCTLQFVLFPQTQKTAGSTTPGSPCTTPSGSSRELVMGPDPPPSRPENGHLSKALLIKTASKPPTPWRWCVYWNTISQKCHCFQDSGT